MKEAIIALRRATAAGVSDIQQALIEADGDQEKALELLRKRGQIKAAKKLDRATNEGLVHSYIHANGRVGVLIEVRCETDFVARNDEFQSFVHDLALQVAATAPSYVATLDVPEDVLIHERNLGRERLETTGKLAGKNEAVIEKILEGNLAKYYEEAVLLLQPSIKDESVTVQDMLTAVAAKMGENIQIKRFIRYSLGEE
ncbi:MAG: translation elongation factor Ts [Patescibacteria group bacterium]|jgi:elongation factor Ts